MADRWKKYLPTFRWTQFRLCHETKDGAYQPIWITQVVGGKWWSLSLTRTAPAVALQNTELILLRDLARATDRWFEAIVSTATTEEADMATRLLAYRRHMDNEASASGQS